MDILAGNEGQAKDLGDIKAGFDGTAHQTAIEMGDVNTRAVQGALPRTLIFTFRAGYVFGQVFSLLLSEIGQRRIGHTAVAGSGSLP